MKAPRHAWILLLLILLTAIARGDDAAKSVDQTSVLRFRRVLVPADKVKEWPTGAGRYLPISAAEFEQWVDDGKLSQANAAAHAGGKANTAAASAVQSARYEFSLSNSDTLAGSAVLNVRQTSREPGMVALEPMNLAVSEPNWIADQPIAAIWGSQGHGPLLLRVEQSGDLKFNASLRGQLDDAGNLSFECRLPRGPANHLVLDLPPEWTPRIEGALTAPLASSQTGKRRWNFALGATHEFTLYLVRAAATNSRRVSLLRQADVYTFGVRGVDLASQLKIEMLGEPPTRLNLQIDRALSVLSVEAGGVTLPWSIVTDGPAPATGSAPTGPQHVVVELLAKVEGGPKELIVKAFCPLTIDRKWKLPTIRTQGLTWQEQTVALQVAAPLVVEQLNLIRGRQTKITPAADSTGSELIETQSFGPDSDIEVQLDRQSDRLQVTAGVTFDLQDRQQIHARGIYDLTVASGERFTLESVVPKSWTIDSVQTVPADAFAERNVERRPNLGDLLSIRLAKPLISREPLRVIVAGHRVGNELSDGEFRWLTFNGASVTRQLAAVVTNQTNHQLKLNGSEELSRVDPKAVLLSPVDRSLLGDVSNGVIFEINDAAASQAISSVPQPPRVRAEIASKITVRDSQLIEDHEFAVRFESGVLNRLVFRFSQAQGEPLEWTASGTLVPHARRIAAEQKPADPSGNGEVWEVTFDEPPRKDFHLRAVRTLSWADDMPLDLACVDEVTSQRGTIEVRNESLSRLEVINHRQNANRRLKAIVADRLNATQYSNLIAAFHYEPTRDVLTEAEPALRLKIPHGSSQLADAWAWRAELIANCPAAGDTRYMATYWIENRGQRRIHFTVPAGETLNHVAIDGESQQLHSEAEHETLTIDLPAGKRFLVLTAYLSGRGLDGKWSATLQPALPKLDIAVLSQQGQLRIPPDVELISAAHGKLASNLNWPQRIFGALGRPDEVANFDPLAPFARSEEMEPDRTEDQPEAIRAVLTALGEAWEQHASGAEPAAALNWGDLLEAARQRLAKTASDPTDAEAPVSRKWLVDRSQLNRLGVTARSGVIPASAEGSAEIGAALLAQSNLTIVVQADAIVLTSRWTDTVVPPAALTLSPFEAIPTASISRTNDRADKTPPALVAFNDWRSTADLTMSDPWSGNGQQTAANENYPGWNSYPFDLSSNEPIKLRLVNSAMRSAMCWALFFATVGLMWRQAAHRSRIIVVVLVLAVCGALLSPDLWRPLFTAIVLGSSFSLLAALFRIRQEVQPATPNTAPQSKETLSPLAVVGAVVVCIFVLWPPTSRAATPEVGAKNDETAKRDEIFDVLIPTDEKGKFSGEYYYVPERLFEILQTAREHSPSAATWLLTDSQYRGELEADPPGKLAFNEIQASLTVRTWEADTRVTLPLGGDGASLLPDGVKLDGKAASLERDGNDGALVFEIEQPGEHHLEFRLHPHVRVAETGAGVTMAIPQLAAAKVTIVGPAKPSWDIVSAAGGLETKSLPKVAGEARIQQTAQLGHVSRLQVRWTSGEPTLAKPADVKVDELLRLRLQPGFTTLDAHMIYQISRGKLSRISLSVDPSLQFMKLANDSPIARIARKSNDPRLVEIELKEPATERLELDLPFLVTGLSDKLQMPLVQHANRAGLKVDKRLLGVWVDAALEETAGKQLKSIPIADFSAAWGRENKSQTAYQLPTENVTWNLSVKPREAKLTARQILAVTCEAQRLRIAFGATVNTSGAYRYGYRLIAPKELEIDSISVHEGAVERVAHWSRDDAGQVQVFLNAPAYGEQKVLLLGSLTRKANKETEEFRLPAIRVDAAELESNSVLIRRRPDVLVAAADANLPKADEARSMIARQEAGSDGLLMANMGRVQDVACLVGKAAQPGSLWRMSANRPTINSRQVVTLSRSGEVWQAALDFHATVRGGEADAFYFWVSPSWRGPFEVSGGDARVQLLDIPGESKPLLLVQPATVVRNDYQISIRGPVTVAPEERVRVPEITPTHAGLRSLHFVLPNQLELQELHWDVRDLKAQPNAPGQNATTEYEVTGSRYRATLQSIDRIPGIPQVRLAEYSLAWSADDTLLGVAMFDLSPAGLDECVLQLPENYRLIHASLGGQPASLTAESGNQWKLPLGRAQLPQRVEILFAGSAQPSPGGPSNRRLEVPRLIGRTPERTIASIYAPADAGSISLERTATTTPVKLLQTRLESDAGLLAWASTANLEEPTEEIDRWSNAWLARLRGSYRELQLRDGLHEIEASDRKTVTTMAQLLQEQAKIAERLATPATIKQADDEARVLLQPADLHAWSQAQGQRAPAPLICSMAGEVKAFNVQAADPPRDDFGKRLTVSLSLIAALVLSRVYHRRLPWRVVVERWPHALLALMGLAWWLWLTPSWLGWPIMLAALAMSIVPSWRQASVVRRSESYSSSSTH